MSASTLKTVILSLVMMLIFLACSVSNATQHGQARFDIGYGTSDMELDLSEQSNPMVDMTVRNGIFHFLSRGESKILRLSSYGKPMAMVYDPSRGSFPLLLKDAVSITFSNPGPLAVDSRQTIYVADRQRERGGWVIRRISSDGKELPFLGREGPGGAALPFVARMDIVGNDGLAATCLTAAEYSIWFFDRSGNYQYSLILDRSKLPVPEAVFQGIHATGNDQIIPSVETLIPAYTGGKNSVFMKMDYYLASNAQVLRTALAADIAGSWILRADPSVGTIVDAFQLPEGSGDPATGYQLLAVEKDNLILMKWDERSLGGTLYNIAPSGRVQGKLRFLVEDDKAHLVSYSVGNDGFLYMLASLPATLRMYALKVPGWR